MKVLVTGAGGFVGTHLVRRLKRDGHWVRGVDLKEPGWSKSEADDFCVADLRDLDEIYYAMADMDRIYHLAADMGGMGFISKYHANIILNNTMINSNMIYGAKWRSECATKVRMFFSSSVCVYPEYLLDGTAIFPITEQCVYPAWPAEAYGWEKLHMEHMMQYAHEAGWLEARVARFRNVYGPEGTWTGGREKAPAALCRKIAVAKLTGNPMVEIWGDGEQVRSFVYIDDCVDFITRIMECDYPHPINLGGGTVETITIDELADLIANIAGVDIVKVHVPGPVGAKYRVEDGTLCHDELGWEPTTTLRQGLEETYLWVEKQVMEHYPNI